MTSQQVGLVANVAIYIALIGFILYREMTAHQLRLPRLVIPPAVLGLFALQQLSRHGLTIDRSAVAFLGVNLAVGLVAGIWRGTTFRIWSEAGMVMTRGTATTLVSWGVLIAIRVPFALVSHVSKLPQGVVIGELLLALAATFGAQNVVLWLRSSRLAGIAAGA